jgi:hypothetical protein
MMMMAMMMRMPRMWMRTWRSLILRRDLSDTAGLGGAGCSVGALNGSATQKR